MKFVIGIGMLLLYFYTFSTYRNKAQQANDGSLGVLSKLITSSTLSTLIRFNVGQQWALGRCAHERWVLERWALERWALERWALERWALERWVLERWVLERWVLERWILERWVLEQ